MTRNHVAEKGYCVLAYAESGRVAGWGVTEFITDYNPKLILVADNLTHTEAVALAKLLRVSEQFDLK